MRRVPWVGGCLRPDVQRHPLGLQLDIQSGVRRLARDVLQLLSLTEVNNHRRRRYPRSSPVNRATRVSVTASGRARLRRGMNDLARAVTDPAGQSEVHGAPRADAALEQPQRGQEG